MSKCKECGCELAEGVKFCGECGAKVTIAYQCPKCGCELSMDAKFCGECGHRLQQQGQVKADGNREKVNSTGKKEGIDWDSAVTMADGAMPLTDEQVEAVAFSLNSLSFGADPDRVVLQDGAAFKDKMREFKRAFAQRIGGVEGNEEMLGLLNEPIGFVDFGTNGLGSRGTLFARRGIFYITKEYPKLVEGVPVGGYVPWKVFYKFGKPRNEKCYCLVDWKEVAASEDVDDDFKQNMDKDDENLVAKFFYINTGLSQKNVEAFMDELKAGLVGEEAIPADVELEEDFEEE